jgi:putative ABC transport system permease protein
MAAIFETALQLGCVYSLVALALFLSYRILDIADLTTDGCFVLGMAVAVHAAAAGHPAAGIFLGMAAGAAAGFVTAFLQTRLEVPSILAGIVTNTGLYTINIMAMGWRNNLSLLKTDTIFTLFTLGGAYSSTLLAAGIMLVCFVVLRLFLSTRMGLSIRATGDNRAMVSASSINPNFTITVGLMISNSFTALSGALAGQLQRTSDINAGTGIVTVGLATLIIGEVLLAGRKNLTRNILACFVGNVVYRLIYAIVLKTGIVPIAGLRLMTALIVAVAIALPAMQKHAALRKRMRREREEC